MAASSRRVSAWVSAGESGRPGPCRGADVTPRTTRPVRSPRTSPPCRSHRASRTRPSAASGIDIRRASAISSSTAATNSSWPISTPTLNISSATGIAFCGRPTSASAPAKPKPCSRPKLKATTHGARAVRPGLPRRPWTTSAATKTMLRAMIASTGGPGHVHPAHRRSDQGDAVRDRERGDRGDDALAAAHDQQQCQHEQQVVDAAEDVFDAEDQIGPGDLAGAGRRGDGELRARQRQPFDLAGAVAALDAGDHVADADRLALRRATSARPVHRAAGSASVRRWRRRRTHCGACPTSRVPSRERHRQRQARVLVLRRNLPQHVVAVGAGLAQFEVGRAENIGLHQPGQRASSRAMQQPQEPALAGRDVIGCPPRWRPCRRAARCDAPSNGPGRPPSSRCSACAAPGRTHRRLRAIAH